MRRYCACGCKQPVPLATATNARWGHVKGKPVRFIRGHHRRKRLPVSILTHFHWLAGILEGEGSFVVCTRKRHSVKRGVWFQIDGKISIDMKDRDIIARVAKMFGTGFWPTRSKMFATQVSGPRAKQLMLRLKPLLGIRRQNQIDRVLQAV